MKISTPVIHTLQLATLPIMDDPHLFLSLQTNERWKTSMQTRVNSVFSLVESRISPKFIFLKLLARIVLGHTRSEANAAG